MDKTIIYITDNKLDDNIFKLCQTNIKDSVNGYPIISVSQKPIDFGENICVGELERNSLSINLQMMEGLKKVKTDFIAIAEHDCLYTKEHFSFIPSDLNTFYYNVNVWMLQCYSDRSPEYNGLFSWFRDRKANSQLVVGTEIMIKATQDRIDIMSDPAWIAKHPTGRVGEAGAMNYDHAMRLCNGKSVAHIKPKLQSYLNKYQGRNWKSKLPNVDIRHKDNFTKNRRGSKRIYSLPYWGTLEDIFNGS